MCVSCSTDLALEKSLIWEGFMGSELPAFLFRTTVNIYRFSEPRKQNLSTGMRRDSWPPPLIPPPTHTHPHRHPLSKTNTWSFFPKVCIRCAMCVAETAVSMATAWKHLCFFPPLPSASFSDSCCCRVQECSLAGNTLQPVARTRNIKKEQCCFRSLFSRKCLVTTVKRREPKLD